MNGKKRKISCLFICILILSPVSFPGQLEEPRASVEPERSFDEVRSPEEVRRAVESKPYDQTIEEVTRQGKSQIRTDLAELRRKTAKMRPKWLTNKVAFSLGTALFLGAVALYLINVLKRHEKKKAMKKLKKIQEDTQKYR